MELRIRITADFSLSAGQATTAGDLVIIHPPEPTMFDQLCAWLDRRPRPTGGVHHWIMSIGATALCLRWGTYLAVLMDESKPVHPQAKDPDRSMISQNEMMRINIEASSNLAALLRQWHQDEAAYYERLRKAYEWLPMPLRQVQRNLEPLKTLVSDLVYSYQTQAGSPPADDETAVPDPYRTVANALIYLTYRSGPIEDVHLGRGSTYSLTHRRFTDRQARAVIRDTAEGLSPLVSDFPLWGKQYPQLPSWPGAVAGLPNREWYPDNWSFAESSSKIQFMQELEQ